MDVVTVVILLLFGVVVGSFLNVIICRFSPEKGLVFRSLKGRSKCLKCNRQLRWFELIPVISFIIQLRKCRGCKNKISWQYPIVEILSAAIFILVPMFLISFYKLELAVINLNYLYLLSGLWVLVFLSWLVVTFIDLKHYIIPNKINLFIGVIGVLIVVSKIMMSDLILLFHNSFLRNYSILFSPFENIVLNHVLGALVAGGFFLIIFLLSKGRGVGLGDVKLMFFSGIALGFPDVGLAMIITFLLGGIWGGFLLITNKKDMKDSVPFGPLLILGMVITIFFGFEIIHFYFSLFGI